MIETLSCRAKDLLGRRFGSLFVNSFSHSNNGAFWNCSCDCGNKVVVRAGRLNSGGTVSCGCLLKKSRERFSLEHWKHGETRHEIYNTWLDMLRRCSDDRRKDFKNYGGRGITVCDRWKDNFLNFLEDMGDRPKGFTLERKNNNLGYSKDNCHWASHGDQNRNSRNSKKMVYKWEAIRFMRNSRKIFWSYPCNNYKLVQKS